MLSFSSFNAFGSANLNVGQSHVPVWLGKVQPVPVGGTLDKTFVASGMLLNAGFPVKLAGKIITPFYGWEVVSFTAAVGSGTTDTLVIRPLMIGGIKVLPAVDDLIQKVGSTFAATGKAGAVASISEITEEGATKGCYTITILHSATIDTPSAGDVVTLSSAVSAGSSKSLKVQPNGYLYNDIYLGALEGDADAYTLAASGAVVMYHPTGLLVELTPAAAVKAQMAAAVPGVYQHLV